GAGGAGGVAGSSGSSGSTGGTGTLWAGGYGGNGGTGGSGGTGGNGGHGGHGGDGAYGVDVIDSTLTNSGNIYGGAGGNGGSDGSGGFIISGGDGGNGGAAVSLDHSVFTNSGTIVGGIGGSAGGVTGSGGNGGVGISALGTSTITNSGSIAGGAHGTSLISGPQANAINLSGGGNTLILEAGWSISGRVVSSSGTTNGGDTLVLGGTGNSSFNVDNLGSGQQYQGFQTLDMTGSGTWTVTGSNTSSLGWNLKGGTLLISSTFPSFEESVFAIDPYTTENGFALLVTYSTGSELGDSTINFDGGTLRTARATMLNQNMILAGNNNFDNGGNSNILSGVISGMGGMNFAGTGHTTLTGANTYAGGTTISAGTLVIGHGGTAGSITGDVTNNAALFFNRSDALSFAGEISGSGSLTQQGAGTLTLTGSNSYTGGTTISDGTLQIGDGGVSGSIDGNVTNSGALIFNRSDDLDFVDEISGSGSLTQQGGGILTLTGSNSYTGSTTISGGTLQIGDGGVNGSIDGNVTNNGALIFNRSDALSFAGEISGSGSLIQQGVGTLTLVGANTYSGDTIISAGKLLVNGSIAGNTFVNSGAILGGSGTVGNLVVNSGGILSPGNSPGLLNITGDLTLSPGSTTVMEIDGPTPVPSMTRSTSVAPQRWMARSTCSSAMRQLLVLNTI
ncbi:autotransporter-associated beta strand repeat-containing protein, partial [Nitrincola sp. A-D6]|uniref:autotransporter-associated beta strand repeat-containing protein n=1 Tax=Nitrincola sp. A-D6 TaxID=1545442 RepID=UPI00190F46F1